MTDMYNAMVFTCEEFDNLVSEVTYDRVSFLYKGHPEDEWFFDGIGTNWIFDAIEFSNSVEYNAWLECHGEEALAFIDEDELYDDTDGFVCRMLTEKLDVFVKTVIADIDNDAVAVIFEMIHNNSGER